VQNRIQTVMVLGLVVLALVGGAGQAAAGQQPRGASAPQIGWAARSQPVPGPRPSAPSSSAPAGDRRGNAVVTAAALLLALGSRPIRRRRRGRRWGKGRPVATRGRRHGQWPRRPAVASPSGPRWPLAGA
jgi:hypothetical protein